jgi:hypothetical protein
MREPGEYGNDEVPIPVFYVLGIYQGTFRQEKAGSRNSYGGTFGSDFVWVTIYLPARAHQFLNQKGDSGSCLTLRTTMPS